MQADQLNKTHGLNGSSKLFKMSAVGASNGNSGGAGPQAGVNTLSNGSQSISSLNNKVLKLASVSGRNLIEHCNSHSGVTSELAAFGKEHL